MTQERKSGYQDEKTVYQVGREWFDSFMANRELANETAYGMSQRVVATITLAGGGPAAWLEVEFDQDDVEKYGSVWECEPLSGTYYYAEPFETPVSFEIHDTGELDRVWRELWRDSDQVAEDLADEGE